MKVTTELKHIVNDAFDKKATEWRKKKCEEYHREYEKAVEWIRESDEYKKYVEATTNLGSLLDDDYKRHKESYDNRSPQAYIYRTLVRPLNVSDIIAESPYRYGFDHAPELERIETEKNTLLVKLTYEKDMERIQSLLATYGIKL